MGRTGLDFCMVNSIYNVPILFVIQIMGSNSSQPERFEVDLELGHCQIIHYSSLPSQKYCLKTITSSTRQAHDRILSYFQSYIEASQGADELVHLLRVEQHHEELFCSTNHQVKLLFEFSDINLKQEIQQRRQLASFSHSSTARRYFTYKDICNIFYGCLSSLWFVAQHSPMDPVGEIAKFKTAFLACEKVLILSQGVIKIMDPHLSGYQDRYLQSSDVMYSPEKIRDFSIVDDEKCAIFELGMMMLEVALLEPIQAYNDIEVKEEVIAQSIKRAKNIYSYEIAKDGDIHLFELLARMLRIQRKNRYTLDQCISFAEQIYELRSIPMTLETKPYPYIIIEQQRESSSFESPQPQEKKEKPTKETTGQVHSFERYRQMKTDAVESHEGPLLSSFNVQFPNGQSWNRQNPFGSSIFDSIQIGEPALYPYKYHLNSPREQSRYEDSPDVLAESKLINALDREYQQMKKKEIKNSLQTTEKYSICLEKTSRQNWNYSEISHEAYLDE